MEDLTAKQERASAFRRAHAPRTKSLKSAFTADFVAGVSHLRLVGQEMDSPRGRIYLMKMASEAPRK